MKYFMTLLAVVTAGSLFGQGTPQGRIVTQTAGPQTGSSTTGTSAGGTTAGASVSTPVTATGVTGTGASSTATGVGTTATGTAVTPTTGTTTGSLNPVTQAPPSTGLTTVSGTNSTSGTDLPPLQNNTNLFGQVVGTSTNVNPSGVEAVQGSRAFGGGGSTGGGFRGQTAQSINAAPGFTQVMLTLQGTVQSELDHQAILNRFQGLPGFVVVDQIQVVGPNGNVNEAAGASVNTAGENATTVGGTTTAGSTTAGSTTSGTTAGGTATGGAATGGSAAGGASTSSSGSTTNP